MAMSVNTNVTALSAYRNLSGTQNSLARSLEKLSSGFRINRAADDAAGLAISEGMRARVSGTRIGARNAQDGISMLQTAEGALNEVHAILQRSNQLAVQAANGTYSDADRADIQTEFQQLKDEINRIAATTSFNGMNLLDGSFGGSTTTSPYMPVAANSKAPTTPIVTTAPAGSQAATSADGTSAIAVAPAKFDLSTVTTAAASTSEIQTNYPALRDLLAGTIVPQAVQTIATTFNKTFGYLNGAKLGIGLSISDDGAGGSIAHISAGPTGYYPNHENGNQVPTTFELHINKHYFALNEDGSVPEPTRKYLEEVASHEMMHALMSETHTTGMTGLTNSGHVVETFPLWFIEGTAQSTGGALQNHVRAMGITHGMNASQIGAVLGQAKNSLVDGNPYATGYLATLYLGYLAGEKTHSATDVAEGLDTILNDIKNGSSLDDVIYKYSKGTFADTNEFELGFHATADAYDFIAKVVQDAGVSGLGSLLGGSYANAKDQLLDDTAIGDPTYFVLYKNNTKMQNSYTGTSGHVVLSGGSTSTSGVSPEGDPPPGGVSPSSIPTRSSGGTGTVNLQIGAGGADGLQIEMGSVDTASLGLDVADMSSQLGARRAIGRIQKAIDMVSSERAALGASQNRLESTINYLNNTAENLQAAESRIRDTDMAQEMMQLTRAGIIQQAGMSMMSQAQSNPQLILQLLR